ncbi:hypothetical protein PsorP6_014539 [Peronosclerospora sorghi]|uniref:Uncharacterized protein n=1 Tax=Peronosclerospora sorghi TaxID=230839 RepID=A0ACC0VR12_9STRA|nr:hypothetical protein PsorP6_014539 [Peronosclerospora sorghi]
MQFNGQPPGPRFCHVGAVYDSSLVIFGGYDGSNRLSDFKQFRFGEEKFQLDIPESTLIDDLRMLVNNDVISDVTFVGTRKQDGVEGIPVYRHKILCIRCSYFKAMLTGEKCTWSYEVVHPYIYFTLNMRISFFSAHHYDIEALGRATKEGDVTPKHDLKFMTSLFDVQSAKLAEGSEAVCIFVNDVADESTLRVLHAGGTKVLLFRCAGYDMVNLTVAKELEMPVLRVPAYSPYAVADHTAALMLTLNRKIHRSYNRTRELNFRLEGLLGFDLNGKTVGVVDWRSDHRIAAGFGCKVLAYDIKEIPDALRYGGEYVSQDQVWARSDIISLHCLLLPSTKHVINADSISKMKQGVMLINTSRVGLIDTKVLVCGLKRGKIGSVGLDVFEGEGPYFYSHRSGGIIADETLAVFSRFQMSSSLDTKNSSRRKLWIILSTPRLKTLRHTKRNRSW